MAALILKGVQRANIQSARDILRTLSFPEDPDASKLRMAVELIAEALLVNAVDERGKPIIEVSEFDKGVSKLLAFLLETYPSKWTKTQINRKVLKGKSSPERLTQMLDLLQKRGQIARSIEKTRRRPSIRWMAVHKSPEP